MWLWMAAVWANPVLIKGDRPPSDLVEAARSQHATLRACVANADRDVEVDVVIKGSGEVKRAKALGVAKPVGQCIATSLSTLQLPPRQGTSTLRWRLTPSIGAGLVGAKGTQIGGGPMFTGRRYDPIILGALPRAHMDSVIDVARPLIQECYDVGLVEIPDLTGEVVVKFHVGIDGTVTKALLKDSTISAPTVEECIVGHIAPLVFDSPAGGGIVIASYTFPFPAPK